MSGSLRDDRKKASLGANLTRVRATLEAAERQLGYPLAEGFAALNAAESQVKTLRKERNEWRREATYWESLTHVSLGGKRAW